MMNMEIDSTTCNPAYSRARDQNNNGLLMCSPESLNANGPAANLHLMNSSEPNLHHHHNHHQMNLNHNPLSHSHLQGQHGAAYNAHTICPSMHGSNPQITHLHQQDICSSGQSDLESTPSPQPEPIYKRETIDSDNY